VQDDDFPALYRSTNKFSLASQSNFFDALKVHLVTLVLAALLSAIEYRHWLTAVMQLVLLLCALGCSIFLFSFRPDKFWYGGRAVAESIKTITWRYVCRAEPFHVDNFSADEAFLRRIKSVIKQNKAICRKLKSDSDNLQITALMREIRSHTLSVRQQIYVDDRINEQHQWYTNKANFNRIRANWFFFTLILINLCAVVCAILRIINLDLSFWPTDIFVAAAAGVLSWMQAKKYSELAASYTLASYEIGIIKEGAFKSNSDEDFSVFVGDAENAFSREHTQWVARKDV
jgi:hypothetical protein